MTEICGDGPWPPGKLAATGSANYCQLPAGHEDHVDGQVRWPWRRYDPLHELQEKVERLQKRLEMAWVHGDEESTQHVIAHMRLVKLRERLQQVTDEMTGAYGVAVDIDDVAKRSIAMETLTGKMLGQLQKVLEQHRDPTE